MNSSTLYPFGVFPVGTRVRSYDFPFDSMNCYVEGTIIDMPPNCPFPSDAHYCVQVTKRVWGTATTLNQAALVFPPINGSFGKQLVFKIEE